MEIFGALIALPFAVIVGIFYPCVALYVVRRGRFWRWVVGSFSLLIVVALGIEVGMIASKGVVAAHDEFFPLLDRLQGWTTLLGPAALANLALLGVQRANVSARALRVMVGIVCVCSILGLGAWSVIYDGAAHYRTDSEGSYRIRE